MEKIIQPSDKLEGELRPPGDKSMSHRALILGAISYGKTTITGLLEGEDVKKTQTCLKSLGVNIEKGSGKVILDGVGLKGLKKSDRALHAGNSGTLMRILTGILVGQDFPTRFIGDESLSDRPMDRIIAPLTGMGAEIHARDGMYPPLDIFGKRLKAISYELPVASAQVKSSILLAGLLANGTTQVKEPRASRDHTEQMLKYLGAEITRDPHQITIKGGSKLTGKSIHVPADFSSASFFLTAGSTVKESEIKLLEVGINPTRCGFLTVLEEMGAEINITNERTLNQEPLADISVGSSELHGIRVDEQLIPLLIDEIPLIAVLATQAHGKTIISGAREARIKETDRIQATAENLQKMGAKVKERPDGMIINGKVNLKGAVVRSFGDHRMAMAFAVAGLLADNNTVIKGAQWVNVSYPNFYRDLEELTS